MIFISRFLMTILVTIISFCGLSSALCQMYLDDNCPAKVWQDQYRCIMRQNSLSQIMDCVTIAADRTENLVCRPRDRFLDPGEAELYYTRTINNVINLCIIPRNVLIYGPPTWPNGGVNLSKGGVLKMCPKNDPRFLSCLCEYNVGPNELLKFAENFKADLAQSFSCKLPFKRSLIPEEVLRTPSLGNTTFENDNSLSKRDSGFAYVNKYGQPVYINGYIGYPLPFYDQRYLYKGRVAAKRCYAHPDEPVIAACTSWLLPTSTTYDIPTFAPRYATYAREYTSSYDPSETAAPSTTSVESVYGQVTSNATLTSAAATGATTTTSSAPTGATSSSSSGSELETLWSANTFGVRVLAYVLLLSLVW